MATVAEDVANIGENPHPMVGNQHATKHGIDSLKGHQLGLALSRLPKGTGHIARRIATFRRFLEQAVADRNGNGDVGKHLMEGALIQTACRWEGVSQLASRWLYLRAESMSDADRATYLRMTAWASERRDVALKALRIDRAECDTIAALYGPGVLQ